MKDDEIRAIARQLAQDYLAPASHGDTIWIGDLEEFATRFIAAIAEKAKPVALYPCGFKNLHNLVIEKGAFLAFNLNEDEPVTDEIRSAAMVLVGYAKDMSALLAKQPLYTHPTIEPTRVG